MKNLLQLAIAGMLCIPFTRCTYMQTKSAVKFNDSMMHINNAIVAGATIWGDSLKTFGVTGDFARLKDQREKLSAFVDQKIEDIKKMEAPGTGGEKFKNSEIVFLKVEKKVLEEGFKPFESLTAASTEEEKQKAVAQLDDAAKDEEKVLDQLRADQRQFAKDNNFKLEEKK